MTDGASSPRFVEKAPDQLRIPCQRRVQDLDGRAPLDERILGQVHLSEPAFAQQSDDAVVAKELACFERHGWSLGRLLLATARTS